MMNFMETLEWRNCTLFVFGLLSLAAAALFLSLSAFTGRQVRGTNAWFKPFKFALSIGIYSWTMGWFTGYLDAPMTIQFFNWTVILLLGYEIGAITREYLMRISGKGIYKELAKSVVRTMYDPAVIEQYPEPITISRLIKKGIEAKHPKTRYVSGASMKLVLF